MISKKCLTACLPVPGLFGQGLLSNFKITGWKALNPFCLKLDKKSTFWEIYVSMGIVI